MQPQENPETRIANRPAPAWLNTFAGAMLGAASLLLLHRYSGISRDAILYLGQGMMARWPEIFGHDIFFAYGSQASYSIYPWLLGLAFRWVTPPVVFMWGTFASLLLFAYSSWYALRALLPDQQRYWAWLGVLCLPTIYGVVHIFSYNEPSLTSRPLAESFCLLSLGCMVRSRWACAITCLAIGGLFHPLQAIGASAGLWLWAVHHDRRWLHVLWLSIPVVVLALIGVPPFSGLFRRVDAAWYQELIYSRQLFVTLWNINDYKELGFDLLCLLCGWRLLRGQFGRWCLAAAAGGLIGVGASLLLADGLHLELPISLQLWRTLWLAHFFALAAICALLFRHLREKQPVSALLLTLSGLLVWSESDWGWLVIVVLYLVWPYTPTATRDRLEKLLSWIFGLAIIVMFYNHASSQWQMFAAANYRFDLVPLDRALLVFPALALGLPLFALLIWQRTHAIKGKLLLLGVLCVATTFVLHLWDSRDTVQLATERSAYRPDIFGVPIPVSAQVYWEPESLVSSWLVLKRASYYSPGQLAGQSFNRATAMAGIHRYQRLQPLITESLACKAREHDPESIPGCHISASSLRLACTKVSGESPDYIVLPYPQPQPAAGTWTIPDPVTGKPIVTYRLFHCSDLLRDLGAQQAPNGVTN